MQETIFFSTQVKPALGLTAAKLYGVLTVVLEIDPLGDRIVAAECTLTTEVAKQIFTKILINKNLCLELEEILTSIQKRYKGEVSRALITGVKKIHRDYTTR